MDSTFEIEEDNRIIMQYERNFSLIKIYKNNIIPCNMQLTSDIYLNLDNLDINDHKKLNDNFDYYLNKLSVFFEYTLNNSLVFDKNNQWAFNTFINTKDNEKLVSNNIILTFNEPTNDHLILLLHSKLNNLCDNILEFYSLTLSDDNSRNISFTFVGDSEKIISNEEWIENCYHDKPWWSRNDFSTIDLKKTENNKEPYYMNNIEDTILDKIESVVRQKSNKEEKVIKINKFIPKIIRRDD